MSTPRDRFLRKEFYLLRIAEKYFLIFVSDVWPGVYIRALTLKAYPLDYRDQRPIDKCNSTHDLQTEIIFAGNSGAKINKFTDRNEN